MAFLVALEKWEMGPAHLHPHNPSLIFTRVSGYGQTGPWAPRPGYASVCEAESGFRYINGFTNPQTGGLEGPPVRPNISLGDSVAGLHAAFGTVLALLARQKNDGKGSTVDVSIVERWDGCPTFFSHRLTKKLAYSILWRALSLNTIAKEKYVELVLRLYPTCTYYIDRSVDPRVHP